MDLFSWFPSLALSQIRAIASGIHGWLAMFSDSLGAAAGRDHAWLVHGLAQAVVDQDATTGGVISIWGLVLLAVVCIVVNALFVAAESSMVKVRRHQLEEATEQGKRGTRSAAFVTARLDRFLSTSQFAITLASIALGMVAERLLVTWVAPFLQQHDMPMPMWLWTALALALALLVAGYLHVVFGELIPRTVASRKPLATLLLLAAPLRLFHRAVGWLAGIMNRSANLLLRRVFKVEPMNGVAHVHSEDDLRQIVAGSELSSEVTATEKDILLNALNLNELTVREIMTPRSEVVALDVTFPLTQNLKHALDSKHTRFPLIKGHLDETIGLIHMKDMVRLVSEPDGDLRNIKRQIHAVPETITLDNLLKFFLEKRAHLALVVDEFGGALGIATLDNVLEELVGDIHDEFDAEESEFTRIDENEFIVEGGLGIYELEELVGLELDSSEVSTVGGYVTHLLGRLPETGEKVMIEGYEVTATKADGRRVEQLRFRRADAPPPSDATAWEQP